MIRAEGLAARQGSFLLADVSFTLEAGGYGVVIGPAGAGKTTLLETIAGVVRQAAGRLWVAGRDVREVAPEGRDVGLVYQRGYLFPHLDVRANVAYGAREARHADATAERLGVTALYGRPVRGLSGGERQLVALARALARDTRVLLLDEPFSALDPRRRALVRREVRALHRERGLTTLQVTHDLTEAGLLGDVALLLDAGRVVQAGAPEALFRQPVSAAAAAFLGAENVLAGAVRGGGAGDGGIREVAFDAGPLTLWAVGEPAVGAGHAVIRAEEIALSRQAAEGSPRNRFTGTVVEVARTGALCRVTVEVRGIALVAALTARAVDELGLAPGEAVHVSFKAMAVHLC